MYGVSSSKQTADSQDAATTVAAAAEDATITSISDDHVDVADTTSLWSADEELVGELMSMPCESYASDSDSLDDSCSDLSSIDDRSSINSSDSDSFWEVTQLDDSSFFDCSSITDIDYSI